MGIYKYTGEEIIFTGANLTMEDILSIPNGYEITGEIEGNLNDFYHVLTKRDLDTEEITIIEKSRYVYDKENMEYNIKYLTEFKEINKIENENEKPILKGKLILVGTELGHGIKLDKEIEIGGNQLVNIFFNDKNTVLDFISREYLTFYFEGEISLKEELSGQIPLEIKVDFDSFIYDIDRNTGWIDVLEVISMVVD